MARSMRDLPLGKPIEQRAKWTDIPHEFRPRNRWITRETLNVRFHWWWDRTAPWDRFRKIWFAAVMATVGAFFGFATVVILCAHG